MKHSNTHWLAKLLTSAIGVALVVMLTLLAAAFFRHTFDFDIFANYVALMMICITLAALAAPALLAAYRKWEQYQAKHLPRRKSLSHR